MMMYKFWLWIAVVFTGCMPEAPKDGAGVDSGESSVGADGSEGTEVPDGDDGDDGDDGPADVEIPSVVLSRTAMLSHLQALMDIAEANDGNRAAGTSGYAASVAYVQSQLESAGYTVRQHEFNIVDTQWQDSPIVRIGEEPSFDLEDDFYPLSYTGSGATAAPIHAVDVMIPPGAEDSSDSGCEADDFVDFPPGSIALIQRGSCTFQVKSENAVEAGAVAVLIFNEGQPGRRDVFSGALDESYENPLPAFALSYDVGVTLSELPEDTLVTVVANVLYEAIPTQNVVAETGGDASRAIVVGGHLDSVGEGPGINDNGSGIAMVLEMAIQLAGEGVEPDNQLRFMFWGGEELGLLGSMDYVFGLDEAERANIMANLNFDMIASPNPARMVYDGSGSLGGDGGPPGSGEIEAIFADWFEGQGLAFQETPFDGRSDYGPFIWTGIPAGGLFTGAEQNMSSAEADEYGGVGGLAYDECYHEGCDTMENLNLDMLDEMAAAAMDATLRLGFFDGDFGGGLYGPPSLNRVEPRLPDMIPSGCGAHAPVWRR
jgi:Zn-dependent M28 family amino/carboxypeptidase